MPKLKLIKSDYATLLLVVFTPLILLLVALSHTKAPPQGGVFICYGIHGGDSNIICGAHSAPPVMAGPSRTLIIRISSGPTHFRSPPLLRKDVISISPPSVAAAKPRLFLTAGAILPAVAGDKDNSGYIDDHTTSPNLLSI